MKNSKFSVGTHAKNIKKVIVAVLVLAMSLSLVACGGNKNNDETTTEQNNGTSTQSNNSSNAAPDNSEPSSEKEKNSEAVLCTPEAYDTAVAKVKSTTDLTYEEVVELFGGVEGTVNADMHYEGYKYYDWTDGKRTVLLTFQVSGEKEICAYITGDIF